MINDIDLVPIEFHKKHQLIRWMKISGVSLALLTVAILGLFAFLHSQSNHLEQEIERLQSQKAITSSHRQQLEKLNQQKKDLDQQLKLLAGLRSGAAAEQMFVTIDQALPSSNVWITGWNFRRAGTPVENADNTVNTGYFIVIPSGAEKNQQKEETWKIETQMNIQGQSMDHAALSEFVLSLTQQKEIENVRVVNTQLTEINQVKLVNFNLEITVSSLRSKT
ncbi:MAG: PilN domain-containing protein [Gammaproteobacteria bacterium]|nr:PilN domain-containing protein [Gammaproteobacteria bacterium]